MSAIVDWEASHTTYRKGAKWWGRALPYVIDGDPKRTVYGDWWTEDRLARLTVWQHRAEGLLHRLLADDARQLRLAEIAILAPRRVALRGGLPDGLEQVLVDGLPRPTAEDRTLIDAERARRIVARDRLREEIIRDEVARLERGGAPMFHGHPETWASDQLVYAIGGHGRLLLRLARAGWIPNPGDLAPPTARVDVRLRQAEPAEARA